jgi:hypothetical protein
MVYSASDPFRHFLGGWQKRHSSRSGATDRIRHGKYARLDDAGPSNSNATGPARRSVRERRQAQRSGATRRKGDLQTAAWGQGSDLPEDERLGAYKHRWPAYEMAIVTKPLQRFKMLRRFYA